MSLVKEETKIESVLQTILQVDDDTKETPRAKKQLMKRKSTLKVKPGMGAEALWQELQRNSHKQLIEMDKKISDDLKKSYGAHLRNNISKNKPIYMRNFTENTDVSNMEKLYDNTEREKTQRNIHHTNIMYKKSQQNMKKTAILLANDRRNQLELENTLDEFFPENEISKPVLEVAESSRSDQEESDEEVDEEYRGSLLFLTELSEDRVANKNEVNPPISDVEVNEDFRVKFSRQKQISMITDVPGYNSESRSQTSEMKNCSRIMRHPEDMIRHNQDVMRHNNESDEIKISDLVEYSAHAIVSRSGSRRNQEN